MRIIGVNDRPAELAIGRAGESEAEGACRGGAGDLVVIVYRVGGGPYRSGIVECRDDFNRDGCGSRRGADERRSEQRCNEANGQVFLFHEFVELAGFSDRWIKEYLFSCGLVNQHIPWR